MMNVFDFAKDLLFKMKYEQQGSSIGSVSDNLVTQQICSTHSTYHLTDPDYIHNALNGRTCREKGQQLHFLIRFSRETSLNSLTEMNNHG